MRSFRDFFYHMRRHPLQGALPISGLHRHGRSTFAIKMGIAIAVIAVWFLSSFGQLRLFLPNAWRITGFPFWEKKYLILLQNNAELRPTGGFITNYGILTFKNGFPRGLEIHDVYGDIDDHAYIEPPYPHKELLASKWYQGYTFRDANNNPHFPKTAEDLLRMYRLSHPDAAFDGAFAVDLSAIEDIIGVFGKLRVDDLVFTKDNFFELMEQTVSDVDRHNVQALFEERKQPLHALGKLLMKKAIFSPFRLRSLSDAVYKNLEEKHILLSFNDHSLAKKMNARGWDGSLASQPGTDVLAIVESNLGGAKSDRYMDRDIAYTVNAQDKQRLSATLTITFTHNGNLNPPLSHAYKGYLRVYIPRDASLIESPRGSKEETEETLRSIGTIIRLEPGQSIALTYQYRLPQATLQQDRYQLNVWKQPGTDNDHYEVTLLAPQGTTWQSRTMSVREHVAMFEGPLTRDRLLTATLRSDTLPPRIIYQGTPRLNEIAINFNEDLDPAFVQEGFNFSIIDMNEKNPTTDQVRIVDTVLNADRYLLLKTAGMTPQPEERYRVKLRHIRDRYGNEMEPKEITVVQRFE